MEKRMNKVPMYIYYGVFFGFIVVGDVVTHNDGTKFKVCNSEVVTDEKGSTLNIEIIPIKE